MLLIITYSFSSLGLCKCFFQIDLMLANSLQAYADSRISLVHAQVEEISRTRANSDATSAQGTHQQGVTIHIHNIHAPRIPESTAIT